MSSNVNWIKKISRRPYGRLIVVVAAVTVALGLTECGGSANEMQPERSDNVVANDGPEGDSELITNGVRYPLDSALGDIWGVQNSLYQVDYTISNGNFQIVTLQGDDGPYEALVPAQATAVFFASMFSVGMQFEFGSYAYAAPGVTEALSTGTGYFTDAYVGLDENSNQMIDAQERYEVTDGTVEFSGELPDIELRFSLMLSNGASVEGHYTGLFDFTER